MKSDADARFIQTLNMQPTPCVPCTAAIQTVSTPGAQGQGSFTFTTEAFALPAIGSQTVISVLDNTWMAINSVVFICDGSSSGTFQVFALPNGSTTSFVGTFLGYTNDSTTGTSILPGAKVTPTGIQQNIDVPVSFANGGLNQANANIGSVRAQVLPLLQALTNLTDNTTGAASNTLAAGAGIETWIFETRLIDLTAATLLLFTPGYAFKVLSMAFTVEVAATTVAKAVTLTPAIAGVSVTGGVVALTSANCTPVGANVAGSAVTAANTGTAAQTFSIVGSAVTAFVEGSGYIVVRVQNMDTANAIASLAAKVNALQTGVGP